MLIASFVMAIVSTVFVFLLTVNQFLLSKKMKKLINETGLRFSDIDEELQKRSNS